MLGEFEDLIDNQDGWLNALFNAAHQLENLIETCPNSSKREAALMRLEECVMWAKQSFSVRLTHGYTNKSQ